MEELEHKENINENSLIIGCNYHTKWQSDARMRFVLKEIKDDKAKLITRISNKSFWTNISDLIFIMSNHNINKGVKILKTQN